MRDYSIFCRPFQPQYLGWDYYDSLILTKERNYEFDTLLYKYSTYVSQSRKNFLFQDLKISFLRLEIHQMFCEIIVQLFSMWLVIKCQ